MADRIAGTAMVVKEALAILQGSEKIYTAARGGPVGADLYKGQTDNLLELLGNSSPILEAELAVSLMMNAGSMYLNQSQHAQADELYKKANMIAKKSGLKLRINQLNANLAWSAIKQHQYDLAADLLEDAIMGGDGDLPAVKLRRTLLALSVHHREKGNYEAAASNLIKTISLYESARDLAGQCRAIAHLATTYFEMKNLEEAKKQYLKALKLNRQINDNIAAWMANSGLATTYYKLGELKNSVKYYEEYMGNLDRYSRSYYTDQGRVAILEDHLAITNEYVGVAAELAQKTHDFSPVRVAIERGRAKALESMIETKQSREPRKAGTLPAELVLYGDQLPTYKIELASYIASKRDQDISSRPWIQMAPGVENFASSPQDEKPASLTERLRAVPPTVTFLQTYILDNRTVVFVTRADKLIGGAVINIGAKSLAYLIEQYRRSIDVEKPRGVTIIATTAALSSPVSDLIKVESNISKQLYRLLLKPIKDLLPRDPQKNVVIVPHQILWLLPFAALQDEYGELFGDQHVLTYAASESTWRLNARHKRTSDHRDARAWVVGNPDMPPITNRCGLSYTMNPLPGAEQEAQEIAALFSLHQAELFTDFLADRLRLDAWHPNFSVLHLATHGFACHDDPLSSFIVLKPLESHELKFDMEFKTVTLHHDPNYPVTLVGVEKILKDPVLPVPQQKTYPGLLDARTIIGEYYLDADLVTLSACQTGLGQLTGEGMIGFTRAFLTSGARSLLVSLWRVDDRSTKELMVSFYRQYLEHGNKGLALKRAMAETKAQYPEPKHWAGFTLLGMAE